MRRGLLDTGIVLRLFNADDVRHSEVRTGVARLVLDGVELFVAPQVLYETRVVLTRPGSDNGHGLDAKEFRTIVEKLRGYATLLPDPPDLVERWLRLCESHHVVGKRSHDVRLVAWMEAHSVDAVLTLNPRDSRPFPSIAVLTPGTL